MIARRNFVKYLSILPFCGKIFAQSQQQENIYDKLLLSRECRDEAAKIIQAKLIPYLEKETGKKHIYTGGYLIDTKTPNVSNFEEIKKIEREFDDIGWSFDFTNDVIENKRYDIIGRGIQLFADNIKEKLLRYKSNIFYNFGVFDDLSVIKQKRVGFYGYCTIRKNLNLNKYINYVDRKIGW